MTNNLLYITQGSGCADVESTVLESCNLRVSDCDQTSSELLLQDCNELYMCNRCPVDPPYWMPWVDDMKFMLQTHFVNTVDTTPEMPSSGWGDYVTAELLDINFNVITTGVANIASRWLAGWTGDSDYQVLEVDTSLPAFDGLDCFIIRINALDSTGTTYRSLCTNHFRRLDPCEYAIKIEGIYPYKDCYNNFYQVPKPGTTVGNTRFAYSNARYFRARVVTGDDSFEKTVINNEVTSINLIRSYRLLIDDLLPPYATRILTRKILPAPRIFADGEQYSIPSFQMTNQASGSSYFFFTVDMQRECENNTRCVPAGEIDEPPIIPPEFDGVCVDCISLDCFG